MIKTFDVIREMRDAGIVIAGGFHSPMEQQCLEFLLRGEQSVLICPAKSVSGYRIPNSWRDAITAGRLLLISPFGDEVRRTTALHAQARNEFVATLSDAVLIPHASHNGKAEATARHVVERHQPLFTFFDEENAELMKLGARVYEIDALRSLGFGRNPNQPC